CQQGYNPPFTF
nr:immunoglobulin light chain junction region [Macaca mulatta]MOV76343.1 immunoglobulin light chain junction region [Macaca mulatta]MOV76479.1 immunoglobulin light chain junction region [Macaca mulatta]MOV77053.1 immunoglobulin light chain junction region [Macaca mulatta]MOV77256.1 immunoglobulin light chain junction region [Macaca mulatta]